MVDKADSVFISYRRKTGKYPALLVFKDLTQNGYDVFIDYESIDSGKFAEQILNQIASRRHFVVILSPGCLDRTVQPGDWLRREIEYALDMKRNVVPLLFDNFDFGGAQPYLTGKLAALDDYNGLTVPDGYFDEAMTKLRNRFLKQPMKGVVEPVIRTDTTFVLGTVQKAYDAAKGREGQLAALKYLGGSAQWRFAESSKQQLKPQTVQQARHEIQASGIAWQSIHKPLKDRITDMIHEKVINDLSGEWEIGIFYIYLSVPMKDPRKGKKGMYLPTDFYLYSEIVNTDLLRRYDLKFYLENKEGFDLHTFELPVQKEILSAADLKLTPIEMMRDKFIFRRRLNLDPGLSSPSRFTKEELANFAGQLIDIHTVHHIPTSEITIKVCK